MTIKRNIELPVTHLSANHGVIDFLLENGKNSLIIQIPKKQSEIDIYHGYYR